MKTTVIVALLAAAAMAPALAAPAADAHDARSDKSSVCLWTYLIDHTKFIPPQTLQFHMKDGKVWNAALNGPCPDLNFFGFSYVTRDGQICARQQSILVLETHAVCMLGDIVPAGAKTPAH